MNSQLLKQLEAVTLEEQEILDGKEKSIKKEIYTNHRLFEVDSKKLLGAQQLITIRTHTRFVDFPEHKHNYVEMMYICQGSITHFIDGKSIVMEAGDILMMNQHVKHAIEKAGAYDIGINFIALPAFFDIPLSMLGSDNLLARFFVDTLRKNTSVSQYLYFRLKGNRAIENLMENIIDSILREDQQEYHLNQITMGVIFLHLIHHMDRLDARSSQSYEDFLLHTTLQYIDIRYADANMSQLAKELNQSLSSLSRFIKNNTGFTFRELVQRKKFQKAVLLLQDTNLPVSEIVSVVGYENSSYFFRKFREKYQISPKEFRIRSKNKKIQ